MSELCFEISTIYYDFQEEVNICRKNVSFPSQDCFLFLFHVVYHDNGPCWLVSPLLIQFGLPACTW